MEDTKERGRRGELIAVTCWPELCLLESGSRWDKRGVDGYGFGMFGNERVQIKYDATMERTHRVYHELYEKTKGNPAQRWRPSPHNVSWYIFTTYRYAWLVNVDVLAQVETGQKLVQISPTSIGFLFPESRLKEFGCERRTYRPAPTPSGA